MPDQLTVVTWVFTSSIARQLAIYSCVRPLSNATCVWISLLENDIRHALCLVILGSPDSLALLITDLPYVASVCVSKYSNRCQWWMFREPLLTTDLPLFQWSGTHDVQFYPIPSCSYYILPTVHGIVVLISLGPRRWRGRVPRSLHKPLSPSHAVRCNFFTMWHFKKGRAICDSL